MPVYEYKALDARGKSLSGIMDAESAYSARQKLRASKFFPISITEIADESARQGLAGLSTPRFFSRINASEIAMMTRQLATLVGAGFPLLSAIDTLIGQSGAHAYKKLMAGLKDAIVEGKSFAEALSQYPKTFSPFYINMVHAGETSGTLEIILERLADIMENQEALKNRIRTALTYPILMCLIGAVVLFLLMTYIVPGITAIFDEMNHVLPTPTRILILASALSKSYWWGILALTGCMAAAYRALKNNKKGRHLIDRMILSLPLIGDLKMKLAVSHISRTLASLLENGVTMMTSLDIIKNITENVIVSEAVVAAANQVEKGQGLGRAMEDTGVFPFLSIQMIQVGEQSGELETMLYKMASVFENDVESSVLRLTALLEPLMILVMAVVVGFIVISVCLPIFEMNRLIT